MSFAQYAVVIMSTVRALKPVWPAPLKECILALLFGAVLFQEIKQAQAVLELDGIFAHKSVLQGCLKDSLHGGLR